MYLGMPAYADSTFFSLLGCTNCSRNNVYSRCFVWSKQSHYSTVDTGRQSISSAPSRVEEDSVLKRQNNMVPSKRFREDDAEASKLTRCRRNTLDAPAMAKQKTEPGGPMQVRVEPVVLTPS